MAKTVGTFVAEFIANVDGLVEGFGKAQSKSESFSNSVAAGVLKATAITAAFEAGFKAVSNALGSVTIATADYGDMIHDASMRTGLAASELSKLKYAAELSGTSFEGVSSAVGKMSKNMDGNSEAFERLGINVKDVSGQLRPAGEVLGDVADKFSHMQDSAQKAALAQEIFGKAGADMIPLLNEGRDGLSALGDQAERLGLVMNDKAAAAGDAFNDSLSSLEGATAGLSMSLGSALLPPLTVIIDAMTAVVVSVGDWVRANDPLVKSLIDLGQNIVVVMVDFVARAIESIADLVGTVGTVAYALGMDGLAGKLEIVSNAGHSMALGLKTVNDRMADSFYSTTNADKAMKKFTTTVGEHSAATKKAADDHERLVAAINKSRDAVTRFSATGTKDLVALANASNDLGAQMKALGVIVSNTKIWEPWSAARAAQIAELDVIRAQGVRTYQEIQYQEAQTALASVAGLSQIADAAKDSYRVWEDASALNEQAQKDHAASIGKAHIDAADSMKRSFETAMGNITSGIAKGLADAIVNGGNFKDSMINIAKQTADGMLSSFFTGLLNPLTSALGKVGSNLGSILTGGVGSNGQGGLGGILGGIFGGGAGAGAGAGAGGAGASAMIGNRAAAGGLGLGGFAGIAGLAAGGFALGSLIGDKLFGPSDDEKWLTANPGGYITNGVYVLPKVTGTPSADSYGLGTNPMAGGVMGGGDISAKLDRIISLLERGGIVQMDGQTVGRVIAPTFNRLRLDEGLSY